MAEGEDHPRLGMILVAGPSCGGKTTFVRQRAMPEDAVLDFGDILEELGDFRYAASPETKAKARLLWTERLPFSDWVIWSAARREDRGRFRAQFEAQVYVVLAPLFICLDRARQERPPGWEAVVTEWFGAFEPSRSGQEEMVWTG
jgi:predicted kinase